jgi:hypothetical protein
MMNYLGLDRSYLVMYLAVYQQPVVLTQYATKSSSVALVREHKVVLHADTSHTTVYNSCLIATKSLQHNCNCTSQALEPVMS